MQEDNEILKRIFRLQQDSQTLGSSCVVLEQELRQMNLSIHNKLKFSQALIPLLIRLRKLNDNAAGIRTTVENLLRHE
jgi:hypothetical protein